MIDHFCAVLLLIAFIVLTVCVTIYGVAELHGKYSRRR